MIYFPQIRNYCRSVVLHRFDKINKGKAWSEQIKPFNFYHVGFQTLEENGKAVKPLSPFSNDPLNIVYEPFIDYETGEIKQGSHYFKQLSRTIIEYANHLESKFDGEKGVLERKHVQADSVVYIGKEANNIDEQVLDVKKAQEFINEESVYDFILNLTPDKAREIGIKHRSALAYLKKKAKGGELNFNSRNVRRILVCGFNL